MIGGGWGRCHRPSFNHRTLLTLSAHQSCLASTWEEMGLIEQWPLGPKNWLFLPLSLPTGATYFFPGRRGAIHLHKVEHLSSSPPPTPTPNMVSPRDLQPL